MAYNDNNKKLRTTVKIIQHTVLAWTYERKNELSNYYNREKPKIILLNATEKRGNDSIIFFNYNIYERNHLDEQHAGVAVAVRKDVQYRILDNFYEDVFGVYIYTTKGQVIIITHYSLLRWNYLPLGKIRRYLQENIPVYLTWNLNARHHILG